MGYPLGTEFDKSAPYNSEQKFYQEKHLIPIWMDDEHQKEFSFVISFFESGEVSNWWPNDLRNLPSDYQISVKEYIKNL